MSRISSQELKEDQIRDRLEVIYDWINDHLRLLIQVGIGLLVLGLVWIAISAFLSNRQTKADTALAQAVKVFNAPVFETDSEPDNERDPSFPDEASKFTRAKGLFEDLRSSYGSTESGEVAQVYLGNIALEQGDSAAAREHWESYVAEGNDHAVTGAVWLNLLSLDRSEGKAEEVAQKLRSELESRSQILPEPAILWQLGLTLEQQGNDGEAEDTFRRLVDDLPQSPYVAQARQRLPAS